MNQNNTKPQLRQRTRPLELLGMSAFFGVFVGAFVLMGTRDIKLALIFFAVTFIASLVVLATLLIAAGPSDAEFEGRVDPVDPDAPTGSAGSVHRDPERS